MPNNEFGVNFKNLIAETHGIKPEDVTVEFIERQRVKRVYPHTRFEAGFGLYSFTGKELKKLERIAGEFLAFT